MALPALGVAVRGIISAARAFSLASKAVPRIRAELAGIRKLQKRLQRARQRNPPTLRKKLTIASAMVERSAKKNMKGSRTRALRLGRRVTAKPGVLGIDKGTLRLSITFKIRGRKRLLVSLIGPQRVVYARIHEFGGFAGRGHAALIPARPYMGPALKTNAKPIKKLLGRAYAIVVPE